MRQWPPGPCVGTEIQGMAFTLLYPILIWVEQRYRWRSKRKVVSLIGSKICVLSIVLIHSGSSRFWSWCPCLEFSSTTCLLPCSNSKVFGWSCSDWCYSLMQVDFFWQTLRQAIQEEVNVSREQIIKPTAFSNLALTPSLSHPWHSASQCLVI